MHDTEAQCIANRLQLRRWYQSALGQLVLEAEHGLLTTVLADLFGYYLVQIGCMVDEDLISASRVQRRFVADLDKELLTDRLAALAQPDQLPVASDSVDVVVLPHTLEFEPNPHELLREVDRILIPEGHVVILGFNPWSIWGCGKALPSRRRQAPWCGKYRAAARVKDWLSLLGFDIVKYEGYFFRPPLQSTAIMKRLAFLESSGARWWPVLSGAYLMVGRKRVTTLTPIKARWRPAKSILGTGLAKPTANKGV